MQTDRRQLLKVLGATPALALAQTPAAPHDHAAHAAGAEAAAKPAAGPYHPKSFSPKEWRTVRVLSDLIIPADDKSGNASQAGVPEYIDEVVTDRHNHGGIESRVEAQIKGGLAWLDAEARHRFQHDFADCKVDQQREILDLIAWPKKAAKEHSQAVAFFNRFRDLVAGGFYTSKIGIADLQFKGNTAVDHWDGCPPEVLAKLGL
jgi:gluconate 2-dehydrogenase gamma chain